MTECELLPTGITRCELIETLDEGVCKLKYVSVAFDIPVSKLKQLQQGKFKKLEMGKYAPLLEDED